MKWFSRFLGFLTTPHQRIIDEEQRANSKLLAAIILATIPGVLISITAQIATNEISLPSLLAAGAALTSLLALYIFNRIGYHIIAGIAFDLSGIGSILAQAIINRNPFLFLFLFLPLLVSSLFRPFKYLVAELIILLIIIASQPLFNSSFTIDFAYLITASYMLFGGIMIVVHKTHRDRLETIRRQKLEESEMRYALAASAASDGLWDWDFTQNSVYYSPRWKEMLGYKPEEISDSPEEWRGRIHPEDVTLVSHSLGQLFQVQHEPFEIEYRMQHKEGHYIWVLSRGIAVYDQNGGLLRTVGSHSNITTRKQAEDKLQHDALHDALTGLANRNLLTERLQRIIQYSNKERRYSFAVLYLDLDNFKNVNDSLGHEAGDELLLLIANKLKGVVFDLDTVARLGGDEFVILLEGIDSIQRPTGIAERILSIFSEPLKVRGTSVRLTASMGVVVGTPEYTNPEELLRDADIAMYQAKGLGKARFEIFNPIMREQILRRLELERELYLAVQNHEFVLVYQPIISLNTGKLKGFEALIRWEHPKHGQILPSEFIFIAEETGLIHSIGEWVLTTACQKLTEWSNQTRQGRRLSISVNVSGKQLANPDFYKIVEKALKASSLNPSRLKLEITESTILENKKETIINIEKFNEIGVDLHLDDFGTGQSSIGYLHRFSISTLKIDRLFVNQMENEQNINLVRGIIDMAHAMKLNVIAEGIETQEQEKLLKALKCPFGQGYKFAHPLPETEIRQFITRE